MTTASETNVRRDIQTRWCFAGDSPADAATGGAEPGNAGVPEDATPAACTRTTSVSALEIVVLAPRDASSARRSSLADANRSSRDLASALRMTA